MLATQEKNKQIQSVTGDRSLSRSGSGGGMVRRGKSRRPQGRNAAVLNVTEKSTGVQVQADADSAPLVDFVASEACSPGSSDFTSRDNEVFRDFGEFKSAALSFRYRLKNWICMGLKYNGRAYRRIDDEGRVEWEGFHSFMSCSLCEIPAVSSDRRWIHTKKGQKPERKEATKSWSTRMPGRVQLVMRDGDGESGKGVFGFNGLRRCDNWFFCPICGPRVRAARRDMIKLIAEYEADRMTVPVLVTFTIPHGAMTAPGEAMALLSRSFTKARSGAWYSRMVKKWGCGDWVRALEGTVDDPRPPAPGVPRRRPSGVHWHYHMIFWLDLGGRGLSKEEKRDFEDSWKRRWRDVVTSNPDFQRVCMVKDKERKRASIDKFGVHCEWLTDGEPAPQSDAVGAYVTDALSFEISPSNFGKSGQESGRITVFEYVTLAAERLVVNQDNTLFPYAILLMEALKGVHSMRFSDGLKKSVNVARLKAGLHRIDAKKEIPEHKVIQDFKGSLTDDDDHSYNSKLPEFCYIAMFHAHIIFLRAYVAFLDSMSSKEAFSETYTSIFNKFDPLTGEDLFSVTYGAGAAKVPIYRGGKGCGKTKAQRVKERFVARAA